MSRGDYNVPIYIDIKIECKAEQIYSIETDFANPQPKIIIIRRTGTKLDSVVSELKAEEISGFDQIDKFINTNQEIKETWRTELRIEMADAKKRANASKRLKIITSLILARKKEGIDKNSINLDSLLTCLNRIINEFKQITNKTANDQRSLCRCYLHCAELCALNYKFENIIQNYKDFISTYEKIPIKLKSDYQNLNALFNTCVIYINLFINLDTKSELEKILVNIEAYYKIAQEVFDLLKDRENNQNHRKFVFCLHNIGLYYFRLEDYEKTIKLCEKARQIIIAMTQTSDDNDDTDRAILWGIFDKCAQKISQCEKLLAESKRSLAPTKKETPPPKRQSPTRPPKKNTDKILNGLQTMTEKFYPPEAWSSPSEKNYCLELSQIKADISLADGDQGILYNIIFTSCVNIFDTANVQTNAAKLHIVFDITKYKTSARKFSNAKERIERDFAQNSFAGRKLAAYEKQIIIRGRIIALETSIATYQQEIDQRINGYREMTQQAGSQPTHQITEFLPSFQDWIKKLTSRKDEFFTSIDTELQQLESSNISPIAEISELEHAVEGLSEKVTACESSFNSIRQKFEEDFKRLNSLQKHLDNLINQANKLNERNLIPKPPNERHKVKKQLEAAQYYTPKEPNPESNEKSKEKPQHEELKETKPDINTALPHAPYLLKYKEQPQHKKPKEKNPDSNPTPPQTPYLAKAPQQQPPQEQAGLRYNTGRLPGLEPQLMEILALTFFGNNTSSRQAKPRQKQFVLPYPC